MRVVALTTLAVLCAIPALAQQAPSTGMHPYLNMFKYSDKAFKAMTEHPQNREAAVRKSVESFGGKLDSIYWFAGGDGEYDGFVLAEYPDEISERASTMAVLATGAVAKIQTLPLLTADEFKTAMEKAKQAKAEYTPPSAMGAGGNMPGSSTGSGSTTK